MVGFAVERWYVTLEGLGFSTFRAQRIGFRVYDSLFRIQGLGFRVQHVIMAWMCNWVNSGFRVYD